MFLEPGRLIVGNAGVLVTSVLYIKARRGTSNFVIVDAAMNDLVRPTLYEAHITKSARYREAGARIDPRLVADIVGPGL